MLWTTLKTRNGVHVYPPEERHDFTYDCKCKPMFETWDGLPLSREEADKPRTLIMIVHNLYGDKDAKD